MGVTVAVFHPVFWEFQTCGADLDGVQNHIVAH